MSAISASSRPPAPKLRPAVPLDETRRVLRQRHADGGAASAAATSAAAAPFPSACPARAIRRARASTWFSAYSGTVERHAVARRAGLEVVGQRHLDAGHRHRFGNRSVVTPAASWRIRSSRDRNSSARLARLLLVAIPVLERRAGVDALAARARRRTRRSARRRPARPGGATCAPGCSISRDQLAVVREERRAACRTRLPPARRG